MLIFVDDIVMSLNDEFYLDLGFDEHWVEPANLDEEASDYNHLLE